MNKYITNLNRIEFVITYACSGRCKHCSEGNHNASGEHIDAHAAAKAVHEVAKNLAKSGVNDILLSVDAFHQEVIPLETVKEFALAIKQQGVSLRTQPAWLVGKEHDNTYNCRTKQILAEFETMGISQNDGNIILPSGNALKYLSEYFDMSKEYVSPYEENPMDICAISIEPNGDVLGGNIYKTDIMQILESYVPQDI